MPDDDTWKEWEMDGDWMLVTWWMETDGTNNEVIENLCVTNLTIRVELC